MFHTYTNALDLIRALVPVVEQLKRYDANLADQVVREATSVTLNVARGRPAFRQRSASVLRDGPRKCWGDSRRAGHGRCVGLARGFRTCALVGEAAARSPWRFVQGPQAGVGRVHAGRVRTGRVRADRVERQPFEHSISSKSGSRSGLFRAG